MAVTLRQIAEQANVTEMTVSNVLNGRYPLVRSDAIKRARRIKAIAVELGYRPHASAKAMAAGRFGSLGLLLGADLTFSMLPGGILAGIQQAMAERDLHLIVEALPDEALTSEGKIPRLLRQMACDGLLINYNANIPSRMIELLDEYEVPAVWINSKHGKDCVYPDDFGAAREATQRLLALGHRRIAYLDFITPPHPEEGHYSGPDRAAGYSEAMKRHGLEPRVYGDQRTYYDDLMVTSIEEILRASDPPTAFVCYRGEEAQGSTLAAARLGMKVPEDLSLVTFAARHNNALGPTPTAMQLPHYKIGRRAVDMLVRKIDDPKADLPPIAEPFSFEPGGTIGEPPNENEQKPGNCEMQDFASQCSVVSVQETAIRAEH